VLLALTNPIKEAIIKHAVENYAEKVLGQDYGSMGFWVALAMVVVYIPLLGRLAAAHFFGKDGTTFGIGLTGLVSVALTFAAVCMADTSLSGFIPKSIEILTRAFRASSRNPSRSWSSRSAQPRSSCWSPALPPRY